jgi:hypothetical protein
MHTYKQRKFESEILRDLKIFPCVAILGPRQCGKSTLALNLNKTLTNIVYLDLENPSDLRKLDDPVFYFSRNTDKLICLDEIQRRPDLFPVLRSILDKSRNKGQLLILGSASVELIKQSSESLAGRISYIELTPFLLSEIYESTEDILSIWLRGGFPDSFLAEDEYGSSRWRTNFIRTFLERDIPQLGINIPSKNIDRLWRMCAHSHGQILNSSRLGESMGMSYHTINNYLNILEQTFMIRQLQPFHSNLKKRLIKSPKIYIRDSGILHSLLEIESFDELMGHTIYGPSWEGFVIENILAELPDYRGYFYRTTNGSEIDLIIEKGNRRIAIECKSSSAPEVTKGFYNALDDLNIDEAWVIAPVQESYTIKRNVRVSSLHEFISTHQKYVIQEKL